MSEISLELKNIKKSFQEGEDVLEASVLQQKRRICHSAGVFRLWKNHHTADHCRPGTARFRPGFLDGKDVTSLEPNQRNVNTVFQNYALFPHMNVADNIGYGLKLKKHRKRRSAEESKKCWSLFSFRALRGVSRQSFPAVSASVWP